MNTLAQMKCMKRRTDFPQFLKAHGLNKLVVEVGVRYGYNLRQLLACEPGLLVGIDHWAAGDDQDTGLSQNDLNEIYRDVCQEYLYTPNVKILRTSSLHGAGMFPKFSIDFVYIDANHTYEGSLRDMNLWWPRVRQGGILAGHDYSETEAQDGTQFGVVQAVKSFMKEKGIPEENFHSTSVGYGSWLIYKDEGE
jgi:hypothetical protein